MVGVLVGQYRLVPGFARIGADGPAIVLDDEPDTPCGEESPWLLRLEATSKAPQPYSQSESVRRR